jgi:ATP-dependent DNA helicase RecQ
MTMNTVFNHERSLELLRAGSENPTADFRDGQHEAIQAVCEQDSRILVVQKTGWGKSFVYFIATKLLREAGGGPALLVSPLLSLMRNQIGAAERMGVRAATINSSNPTEWAAVAQEVVRGNVDILLISPERLGNEEFQRTVLGPIAPTISLLVIDEAHCISDWGHDFRPHYRLIERTAKSLPPNVRLLATTATANDRVMADLHSILGDNLVVSRGDLARPSLTLQAIRIPDQAGRLAWLADTIPGIEGSGIVYTLTVRDADLVARWLRSKGIDAAAYHGGLDDDKRVARE